MGRSYKGGVRLNRRTMTELVTDWFRDNQENSISVKRLYDELKLKTHPMRSMCLDIVLELVDDGFVETDAQAYRLSDPMLVRYVRQSSVRIFANNADGGPKESTGE